MPFHKREKPSVARGRNVDIFGNQLVPVYPPEYFNDMAMHHRAEFFDLIKKGAASHWRLTNELPNLDKDKLGVPVTGKEFNSVFRGDHETFFKALFKIHEGELLQLSGSWKTLSQDDMQWVLKWATWHVQYASSPWQQKAIHASGGPGAQLKRPKPIVWESKIEASNPLAAPMFARWARARSGLGGCGRPKC